LYVSLRGEISTSNGSLKTEPNLSSVAVVLNLKSSIGNLRIH
jgi:hypothetical protein